MSKGEEGKKSTSDTNKNQDQKSLTENSENFKQHLGMGLLCIDRDYLYLRKIEIYSIIAVIIISTITIIQTPPPQLFEAEYFFYFAAFFFCIFAFLRNNFTLKTTIQGKTVTRIEHEFLSLLEQRKEEDKLIEPPIKLVEDLLNDVRVATKTWGQWDKFRFKFDQIIGVFAVLYVFGFSFAYLGSISANLQNYVLLIANFVGVPAFLAIFYYSGSRLPHFRDLIFAREIFKRISLGYLDKNVNDPLQAFIHSTEATFQKSNVLEPLKSWDKLYRQAFFTNQYLNALLQDFQEILFPLSVRQRFYFLFEDVKSRLQTIATLKSIEGIKIANEEDEVKDLQTLLTTFSRNLKSTVIRTKTTRKERFERLGFVLTLVISFMALIVSIFHP